MNAAETKGQRRRSMIGLALALMVGAGVAATMSLSGSLLESGTPAPPFELPTADGSERVSLESLRGKVVLLDFWATTCPPCMSQLRDLEVLQGQLGGAEGELVILGINSEGAPPGQIDAFAQERGVAYRVLVDEGLVAERYKVQRLPTLYLIDQEGQVRWSRVGYTSHQDLSELVRELI